MTALLYFLTGNDWKRKEYEKKEEGKPKTYDIKKALNFIEFNKSEDLLKRLRDFCGDEKLDTLKE